MCECDCSCHYTTNEAGDIVYNVCINQAIDLMCNFCLEECES